MGNLVIEDVLPAGLEPENERLATAATKVDSDREETLPGLSGVRLDMRDDRVVVTCGMPGAGKARCSYLARAVTAGSFALPPVRAEQMYDLNLNAMSGAGRVVVTSTPSDVAGAN